MNSGKIVANYKGREQELNVHTMYRVYNIVQRQREKEREGAGKGEFWESRRCIQRDFWKIMEKLQLTGPREFSNAQRIRRAMVFVQMNARANRTVAALCYVHARKSLGFAVCVRCLLGGHINDLLFFGHLLWTGHRRLQSYLSAYISVFCF